MCPSGAEMLTFMFVVNLGVGFLHSESVFLQLHSIIGYEMMIAVTPGLVQHNPVTCLLYM